MSFKGLIEDLYGEAVTAKNYGTIHFW